MAASPNSRAPPARCSFWAIPQVGRQRVADCADCSFVAGAYSKNWWLLAISGRPGPRGVWEPRPSASARARAAHTEAAARGCRRTLLVCRSAPPDAGGSVAHVDAFPSAREIGFQFGRWPATIRLRPTAPAGRSLTATAAAAARVEPRRGWHVASGWVIATRLCKWIESFVGRGWGQVAPASVEAVLWLSRLDWHREGLQAKAQHRPVVTTAAK
jgi:hypothetical protein